MASPPNPPRHGFEDVVSTETDCTLLTVVLSALSPRHLRDHAALEPLWRLSLGQSVPLFRRVRVVGEEHMLNQWAPLPNNRYPPFISPIEYTPRDDTMESVEPMLEVEDGDLLLLLPGVYNGASLWDVNFEGNNLVVGLPGESSEDLVTIYAGVYDGGPMVHCMGRNVLARLRFEPRSEIMEPVISVVGSARMHLCAIEPARAGSGEWFTFENGGIETDDLVHVDHGAGLVTYGVTMGPSTSSCIKCDGQCVLLLMTSTFQESGRGNKVQRISKANGTFPLVLQGVRPAIAVSFATVVQAKDCTFRGNYGYPIQYAEKTECGGQYGVGWLVEKSAEEHAREKVKLNRRFDLSTEDGFDLSTEDGEEALFRKELASYRHRLAEVPLRRTKGSLEMTRCAFDQNSRSPHLPDLPNGHQFSVVEPWFGPDSKILELVDAEDGWEAIETYYQHEEAKEDRNARVSRYCPVDQLSPTAKELRSFAEDGSVISILSSSFRTIRSHLDPEQSFIRQREAARNDPGLRLDPSLSIENTDFERLRRDLRRMAQNKSKDCTAYGLMSEKAQNKLRETLSMAWEESCTVICEEARKHVVPDVEELVKMCWGALTDRRASFEEVIAVHAVLVSLYENSSRSISSYRAEVLVERLHCDEKEEDVSTNHDGCGCKQRVPAAQVSVFLLGLSHPTIVCALTNLLQDKRASDHGRRNAGVVLMYLAFAKPDLFHERAVQALSGALSDEESNLSSDCQESLVNYLAALHAKEATDTVREAFKRGQRNDGLNDGFIAFLQRVGLPIDLDDEAVAYEIANIELVLTRGTNTMDPKVQGMYAKAIAGKKYEVKEHNLTLLGWAPCDHCGKLPPSSEDSFSLCSGCRVVAYCDKECQRAAWKEHREYCKCRQGK